MPVMAAFHQPKVRERLAAMVDADWNSAYDEAHVLRPYPGRRRALV
jgi:hypothetical protein